MISLVAASGLAGDNLYNTTGAGETIQTSQRRGTGWAFYVCVSYDGKDCRHLHGQGISPHAGATVRSLAGTTNITTAMRSATGWKIPLAPGVRCDIKMILTPARTTTVGSLKRATVTTQWLGDGSTDTVNGTVKVER